ncbi:MAG: hypothetical protein ACXVJD_09890 [Mucilaginibacter sp.]
MLKELLNIGGYPSLGQKQYFSEKAGTLLKVYGLLFIAIIILAPLIIALDGFVIHVLHFQPISPVQHDGISRIFHKLGFWKAAVYIGLIGPLLEEMVFRLPLSLKKKHIALAFAAALFLFAGVIFLHFKGLLVNFSIRLVLSAAVYFTGILLLPAGLSVIGYRFYKQLIVLSICLFGLMHIGNYTPLQWPLIWIYPVYVLPQLLMGWAITYIRFKNGFLWGFALHCLINSVSVLFSMGKF